MAQVHTASPFIDMPRAAFSELAAATSVVLSQVTIDKLRGLGDPTDVSDVQEVYHPLTELIGQYVRNTGQLYQDSNAYLGLNVGRTPFIIAIAGSVAVGKSTVARLLAELISRTQTHPKVALVTTDGFLHPNAVLEEKGILERKGFPESYDAKALLQFVLDVKSGIPEVRVPVYSHVIYDIVPGEYQTVSSPDILILEGLNVLQPSRSRADGSPALSVSDFLDFSVYVDADEDCIKEWFWERFLKLRDSAFKDPDSYFRQYARLSDADARAVAEEVWESINGLNLRQNILPTRDRARVILRKAANHEIETVRIRKV
jgi:type I pantothenate kinase